jgi:WhiB family transcriptional regulator, redox-sensing transcriptional regulator
MIPTTHNTDDPVPGQPGDLRQGDDLLGLMFRSVPAFLHGEPERWLRASITPQWQEHAGCASTDAEQWFQVKGGFLRLALAVCAECPVRRSCLATALLFVEDGIWAGTTPSRRRAAYLAISDGVDIDIVLDRLLPHQGPPGKPRRRRSGKVMGADPLHALVAA